MAEIRVDRVTKLFKNVRAVDDVSLTIADGEFMVLLGPSGCGKTTLLRSIAGLEQIDGGRIVIGEREVTDLPPRKRNIAMVFQSYAVFPHMTVFENIAFGLRMHRASKADIRRQVHEAAELLHIDNLLERYPSQTSGGQRQRIAVARALAMQPQVLLMDEPLSNLDALLRLEARAELKRLLNEIGSTTIYVTHDQVEAMSMGDRVAVMRSGKLIQVGSPLDIYDGPVDRFVGGFIGNPPMNFLSATIDRSDGRIQAVIADAGAVEIDDEGTLDGLTGEVLLGIRAENVEVRPEAGSGALRGRVLVVEPLGSHNLVTLQLGAEQLKATTRPDAPMERDQEVGVVFQADRIRWLDAEAEVALGVDVETDPGAAHGAPTEQERDADSAA
ncbi:MAG TPA: ABC transporter ATP-binding protein [Candidatus Limnocylindrales bacterium]|nr:ABC transporter ATP-binding protein [Candidatus Limnocylindrales bacterium]